MARSFKKHPVMSYAIAHSEKKDKIGYNRRMRVRENSRLRMLLNDFIPKHLYEYSNPYCMQKDGSRHWMTPEVLKKCHDLYDFLRWCRK